MPIYNTKFMDRINTVIEYGSNSMNNSTTDQLHDEKFLTKSEEKILKERGYTFIRQLGEGSYAKVYLAKQVVEGKPETSLACKIINTRMAPREFIVKFLPRELDILSKITHPYIVHVYSIYHKAYNYLIFMRHAEMGDMLDYIVAHGELPEKVARVWFHQLSCAIYYLHCLNIAHRDIKCENVLITINYNVKLADFGFARYVVDANHKYIISSTYCGSLAYASPEILRGRSYYPKSSDIWSLGIVLYVMLNKCMPFHDVNVKLLYKQQCAKKWKFRLKVRPHLSASAINIVTSLLEPDFRKRIAANDLVSDPWFTEEGLFLNEDCQLALETTAQYKEEMVIKKHSKLIRSIITEAKEFTVVAQEKEPLTSLSVYFDLSGERKSSIEKTNGESFVEESDRLQATRVPSNILITGESIED